VLTAVEHTGAPVPEVRSLLHAVFKRARDLGLTVDAAEKGLRSAALGTDTTRRLLSAPSTQEDETSRKARSRAAATLRPAATTKK